jgi:hypothetical protein
VLEEMIRPTDAAVADANPWQVALLLVTLHGSRTVEIAREEERQVSALERTLWQYVIAAAEELLGALSPTDLLYATALAPRSEIEIATASARPSRRPSVAAAVTADIVV